MAEKGDDAGPSNTDGDSIEQTLDLTSDTFDPMRLLYAPNLDLANENVEIFSSVSQFVENVNVGSPPSVESSASFDDAKDEVDSQTSFDPKAVAEQSVEGDEKNSANIIMEVEDNNDLESKEPKSTSSSRLPESQSPPSVVKTEPQTEENESKTEENESKTEEIEPKTEENESKTEEKPRNPKLTYRKRPPRRTLLTEMTTGFQDGPLSVLRRSVEERLKVKVFTRSVRNVRGVSTGYIVAFDKHMNLAMMDVDEVYRKPVGKHQKKPKTSEANKTPLEVMEVQEMSDDGDNADVSYPKAPWQPLGPGSSGDQAAEVVLFPMGPDTDSSNGHSEGERKSSPADGIGDLPSAFRGMHVFEDNETTRLLGAKSRRVLVRHLNQVLLRGEHVVSVALAE